MTGEPKLFTVTWSVLRDDGPEAYVLEFTDGQLALTFGPMPKGNVETFLIARKKHITAIIDRALERLNDGKDTSQEDQAVPGASVRGP